MKCKDCKHWKLPKEEDYWPGYEIVMPLTFPDYEHIKDETEQVKLLGYSLKYCTSPKLLFHRTPTKDGACMVDAEEYKANLITGEDFGCANFESDYKTVMCYPENTLKIN